MSTIEIDGYANHRSTNDRCVAPVKPTRFANRSPHHPYKEILVSDKIANVTAETFDEIVGAADGPVLVDFWAEWCGPCKMIAPILDEIAAEHEGSISIAKVNVDEAGELAQRFEVMSIPTLIVFTNGEPAKKMVGASGKAKLLEDLAEFI